MSELEYPPFIKRRCPYLRGCCIEELCLAFSEAFVFADNPSEKEDEVWSFCSALNIKLQFIRTKPA